MPISTALAHLDELVPGPSMQPERLRITGSVGFSSAFDVDTLAMASAAATNLTNGITTIDRDLVAATHAGHLRVDGKAPPKWADLSGYYRTNDDRHIQFHANFAHHAAGIVDHLGCDATRESVQAAVLEHDPIELETALIDRGLIAARLRTMAEWDDHPHAVATRHLPLLTVTRIGDGAPRTSERPTRVLDCSRILAGPVAGQTLAAHGADVLRVGAAHLPSVEMAVISTGFGKRNTFVDLRDPAGREMFAGLLSGADVWIDAYRPGALAGHGFDLDRVEPGTIAVRLDAFDRIGPWRGRRGFDSIVQSTTGIVEAGRAYAGAEQPVPLPVQALDYATGHLAAAAASKLVAHQRRVGGTWLVELSLLRTRNWLVSLAPPVRFEPAPVTVDDATLHTVSSPFGLVEAPRALGGSWSRAPHPLGNDAPTWAE